MMPASTSARIRPNGSADLPADEAAGLNQSRISLSLPKRTSISWLTWLGLAGVLGLGLVIRMVGLNQTGFNTDEAVYAGQAAGILNDLELKPFFPIFRAHPLLFQFLLALTYSFTGVSDYTGRMVSVIIGALTVAATFALGKTLYGAKTGLLAALFMALMPYHVVVTRQVLLDGPMTLFSTFAVCVLAQYALTHSARWLYAAGVLMGLTFLAKETGIILIGAVYLFLALNPSIKLRLRDLVIATLLCLALIAIFPLVISLSGSARTGQNYLIWQLLRRPNHGWEFYAVTVVPMVGVLLVLSAIAGLVTRWKQRTWRETLLVVWIIVPVMFFQLWSVKGFQYLLPAMPPLAVLSAVACTGWMDRAGCVLRVRRLRLAWRWLGLAGAVIVALSLAVPSGVVVLAAPDVRGLAGAGGLPGGRETGLWFKQNTVKDAQVLAVGPAIANLIQFYGHRKTHMLSISINPLERNPAYDPIVNPDLELRKGEIHYIVWDAYSAGRSRFFSNKLLKYVQRYNGRPVHAEFVGDREIIVVYEVHP